MLSRGIDISAWQGEPDIKALKAKYKLQFIAIKASEGASFVDPHFTANWAHAKEAGLIRLAYHFARPEQSDDSHQAQRLIDLANPSGTDMLCNDLEQSKLGQTATNVWARNFGDYLRKHAHQAKNVLYMGHGYSSTNTGRNLANHYDMWWYPQYPHNGATIQWPRLFMPWLGSANTTGWKSPHIWQWTDALSSEYDADVTDLTVEQFIYNPRTGGIQMKRVAYLKGTDATEIAPGQRKSLSYNIEMIDPDHLHADGDYPSLFPKTSSEYLWKTLFSITAPTKVGPFDVRFGMYERHSNTFVTDRSIQTFETSGNEMHVAHNDVFRGDVDHKYRVDITNRGDETITVGNHYLLICE